MSDLDFHLFFFFFFLLVKDESMVEFLWLMYCFVKDESGVEFLSQLKDQSVVELMYCFVVK